MNNSEVNLSKKIKVFRVNYANEWGIVENIAYRIRWGCLQNSIVNIKTILLAKLDLSNFCFKGFWYTRSNDKLHSCLIPLAILASIWLLPFSGFITAISLQIIYNLSIFIVYVNSYNNVKKFCSVKIIKGLRRSTMVINRGLLILTIFSKIILKHSITSLVPLFFLKTNLFSIRFSLIFGSILLYVIYVSISEAIHRETNMCTHVILN